MLDGPEPLESGDFSKQDEAFGTNSECTLPRKRQRDNIHIGKYRKAMNGEPIPKLNISFFRFRDDITNCTLPSSKAFSMTVLHKNAIVQLLFPFCAVYW